MSITYRIVSLGLAVALTGFTNAFASDYQAGSNLTIEYEASRKPTSC